MNTRYEMREGPPARSHYPTAIGQENGRCSFAAFDYQRVYLMCVYMYMCICVYVYMYIVYT